MIVTIYSFEKKQRIYIGGYRIPRFLYRLLRRTIGKSWVEQRRIVFKRCGEDRADLDVSVRKITVEPNKSGACPIRIRTVEEGETERSLVHESDKVEIKGKPKAEPMQVSPPERRNECR